MRWKLKPSPPRPNLREWHSWFAWFPVEINGEAVWWERVERKGTHYAGGMGDEWWEFEYRNPVQ